MKKIFMLSAWLLCACYSHALVRFTMVQTSVNTVSFYFTPIGSNISFSTDIFVSNVTFTLRIPTTYAQPTAANWGVTGNTTYVTNATPDAVSTSNNETNFHNVKFGWTSGNNMNGRTFVVGQPYRLASMTIPAGVAISDITFIDWANNRVNTGAPLFSTSLNMGGLQEDDTQLWYQSTSSNPPVNGGSSNASSTLTLIGTFNPLPLKLLSFDATKVDDNRAWLNWQTAGQEQTDYFEVERAADGKTFTAIGRIEATGNISAYQLYDNAPLRGINYYRLKWVEQNGLSGYSSIRTVAFNNRQNSYTLSPNPANNFIRVSGVETGVSVRLINLAGQMLREQQVGDATTVTIGLDGLAQGMYYVQIVRSGHIQYSKPFVKQ